MSGGYTEIEYGTGPDQVKITNCQTLEFKQEEIYDSSGLNQAFEQFTVRVSGYLLAKTTSSLQITPNVTPSNGSQTAGTQYVGLREKLCAPRQEFKMTLGVTGIDPTLILHAKPVTSKDDVITKEFDVQGGPIPKVISFDHVTGNETIKVEWEVRVCLALNCPSNGYGDAQRGKGILCNRWTCADDIDENSYIRSRNFVGELKLGNPLINPHDFRKLVVPAISPGMRVKSMSFRISEDSLNLQYNVVHEEVTFSAPHPATNIRIHHKVGHGEHAVEIEETLAITLMGDRSVDKRQLVSLAGMIADGKIRRHLINGGTFRLLRYEMSDECGSNQQNQITVMYQTRRIPNRARAFPGGNELVGITARFGRKIDGTMIPEYDSSKSLGMRTGESPPYSGPISVAGAFAQHLQSSCTQDHSINRGIVANSNLDQSLINSIGYAPSLPAVEIQIVPDVPDLPDSTFNSSHTQSGMYQTYEIDSQVEEKPLILQAPISSPASPSYQSGGTQSTNPGITPTPIPSSTSGDTSAFIRIGPSQWERVVRVCAKRHGFPPRLSNPNPHFRDGDGVLNVLKGKIELTNEPLRLPDGTFDYVVRAEYRYGLSRAPVNMKFGAPDYENSPTIGSNQFQFSLVNIYSSHQPIG
jgi:hypothetical protein